MELVNDESKYCQTPLSNVVGRSDFDFYELKHVSILLLRSKTETNFNKICANACCFINLKTDVCYFNLSYLSSESGGMTFVKLVCC